MIVVKIELHSAITGKVSEIGRMVVSNDGTGTKQKCNYTARVCRKGSEDFLKNPTRSGKIVDYPRQSYTVWKLIHKALKSCYPEFK